MRAMKTFAKKNESMNAPVGPCTTFSHCACGYNIRKELVSAAKSVGVSSPTNEYAYQFRTFCIRFAVNA